MWKKFKAWLGYHRRIWSGKEFIDHTAFEEIWEEECEKQGIPGDQWWTF